MKNLLLALFLTGSFFGSAQADLNKYKYVIVPVKFNDFKHENQYKTSTLVKYLFEKKGFNPVYDNALPPDLSQNRCLGLLVNLKDDSNMFTTKVTIVLKDCNNKEVFVTQEGISKIKEFDAAYSEAIREAMSSFDGIDYHYEPSGNLPAIASGSVEASPRKGNPSALNEPAVEQSATPEQQSYKDMTPVPMPSKVKNSDKVLYAQEIPNGYQLVDKTPKVVLKLLKSSVPNVYTATGEDRNGMVYNRDGKWFFEYYVDGKLTVEELDIKF